MLNRIASLLGGDYNQKEINKILPLITKINEYNKQFELLTDEEIKAKTLEFKERLKKGETLDDILPEAFATVKQACKRLVGTEVMVKGEPLTWNMIPYDVQLIGGIILHQGKISEMKTGEGKTLVAVAPVYLNALSEDGVHVVTVNDYLASRDSQWMGCVYEWLGLSVGSVTKTTGLQFRREEYSKDITYVENSELGFDYLRDNLVKTMDRRSLMRRPLNFAIVDEIDSILIDEARTPLIISEAREEPTEKYQHYSKIIELLTPCSQKKKVSKGLLNELMHEDIKNQEEDGDYYIDEKTKTAALSGMGITKLEGILGVENLYKDLGFQEIHHIENALRSKAVYKRDVDYIVANNEILIVDEHTGRTMQGRRFSEGLHQAIEAKEGVEVKRESQTMATITYQNFFKQYKKLGGMTGTAATEGEEFNKIYELEVVLIPTNKEVIRVDKHDKVYFNQSAKWKFVKEYIKFYHEIGQPILIGTADIATSEHMSRILEKETINHYVLNAKFHEQEAHIVANAGKFGSVVVATNMAGRGTDIKLENGLNERLAENYAKRFKKALKSGKSLQANLYSELEYNLTLEALKKEFELTDDEIKQTMGNGFSKDGLQISITLNKGKKQPTDICAKIKLIADGSAEFEEKDIHYGLFILGTEKHESRRIDNQLRGRAGRQGDPGTSVFFVALDDTLMRKMGGERIQSLASMLIPKAELENMELTQKQFTSAITRSQKEIEGRHFSTRKHLFDYDSVIDKQRKNIYRTRDEILEGDRTPEVMNTYMERTKPEYILNAQNLIANQIMSAKNTEQSIPDLLDVLQKEFGLNLTGDELSKLSELGYDGLNQALNERLEKYYKNLFETVENPFLFTIFKDVHLHFIDIHRVNHIDEMQQLKDKVGFMGYAQLDPLVMYKKESFDKFQELLTNITNDTTTYLLRQDIKAIMEQQQEQLKIIIEAQNNPELLERLKSASKNVKVRIQTTPQPQIIEAGEDPRKMIFESEEGYEVFEVGDEETKSDSEVILPASHKIRPNDPCPCGSGKKYKKCHGAEDTK